MRFSAFCALAFPIVATATVIDVSARDQCSGGQFNCCSASLDSTPENLALLSALLGISLPSIGGRIGLTCSSLASLAVFNQNCGNAQLLCCTNNNYNGLVALGCRDLDGGF